MTKNRSFVTTCDEPVQADLSLKALKYIRDYRKLKWYRKVKHMNDERLLQITLK